MKNKLLIASLLLFFVEVSFSCKKPDTEPNYPIEISFEEYSFEGTQCQWANLSYNDKVIVINSNEELEKYIICAEDNYPAVDFSKHSLLLASGLKNITISAITVCDLTQTSVGNYQLKIEIDLYEVSFVDKWYIALVVKKINTESNIVLNVHEIIKPSLIGTKWQAAGIVDEETGILRIFEPKEHPNYKNFNEKLQQKITLIPNPTTGELKIENGELKIIKVDVFDVYGRMQKSKKAEKQNDEILIDVSHLPAGVFFVIITTESGTFVEKIIKQ